MAKAIIDTNGANCPSCRRAIEHCARRLKGIEACKVDISTREIHVEYDGSESVIEGIVDMVDKLGYDATPRPESPAE
jgi:copper chaperone CopZ|tara:strand:+ start:89 stop:319 length:231 start_codon:yes stop_codon:yes gene_type:complete